MLTAPRAPVIRVNTAELRRRVQIARKSGDGGRAEAARVMGAVFTEFVAHHAPRDTNRYVRGWIEAGREVRATQLALPPLKRSRLDDRYGDALLRQIERLAAEADAIQGLLDSWFYSKGRDPGSWGRAKERKLRQVRRRLQKATEQYEAYLGSDAPVLFFAGSEAEHLAGANIWRDMKRRASTVRTKVYGGKGALLKAGHRVFVRLHNLEPHASLVERRTRVVGRALGQLRRVGVRRAGRAYLERQAVAGGLRVSAGSVSGSRALPGMRD